MDNDELCRKFSNNPKVNPETGGMTFDRVRNVKYYTKLCKSYGYKIKNVPVNRPKLVWVKKYKPVMILPEEIIIEEIIMKSDVPNFTHICQSNKKFQEICKKENFWERLYIKYYADTRLHETLEINEFTTFFELFKLAFSLDNLIKAFKIKNTTDIVSLYLHRKLDLSAENVSNHNLRTSIPYGIGYLTNLSKLNLSYNKINEISDRIGNLKNLKSLNLSNNKIKQLPLTIGDLINLEYLYLSSNLIVLIPQEIGRLKNLKYLDLSYNQIEILPKQLFDLHHLIYLDLNNNSITIIPIDIGKLNRLRELNLSFN